jgi:hypothetical protein
LCTNGVKDQDETDVDCGGSCPGCAEFKACNVDSDCASGLYCQQHIKCIKPTCDDGIKNQNEVEVDCGGKCGGYWYDNSCHSQPQPYYSGKVELSILDVGTSINPSSGYAKIDDVTFKVVNGKNDNQYLLANVFARKSSGTPYYESQISGEEIPVATKELPILSPGVNATYTVNISRTLTQTEPDDEYKVVVELRDSDDNLVAEATWTNS